MTLAPRLVAEFKSAVRADIEAQGYRAFLEARSRAQQRRVQEIVDRQFNKTLFYQFAEERKQA